MEHVIKQILDAKSLQVIGGGSGCINSGTSYRTDTGKSVFVKMNSKAEVDRIVQFNTESIFYLVEGSQSN